MTTKINDILTFLDKMAPMSGKMPFDNVGLLVGDGQANARRVLLSLDVTPEVVREAAEFGAELIVLHHPVIRDGLLSVTPESSQTVFELCKSGIAAICMHTNLDAAAGGVNDELARILELSGYEHTALDEYNIGRVGNLPEPLTLAAFLPKIKTALNANGLRYYDAGRTVRRVAVCGGSGEDYCNAQLAEKLGFDTLVSSDFKHHTWLEAKRIGLNAVDAGHYNTENVVVPILHRWLTERFPELELKISERHIQIDKFF